MTKQEQIEKLDREIRNLNESLSRAYLRIDELESKLNEKQWPALQALETFESEIRRSVEQLRKTAG